MTLSRDILSLMYKKRLPPPQNNGPPITDDDRPAPPQLDRVVVGYGKDLSTLDLGMSHPLTAVWTVLDGALKISTDDEIFSRALERTVDEFKAQLGPNHAASLIMRLHLFSSSEGDTRWKEVVIKLLTVLEGGRGRGRGSAVPFLWLKNALEGNEFTQEHVNRITKFICRLLRARMYSAADGQVDLVLEDGIASDPEAELVKCLYSQSVVMDADYLP